MNALTASHRPSSPIASARRFFARLADNLERTGSARVRFEFDQPWRREPKTPRGAK